MRPAAAGLMGRDETSVKRLGYDAAGGGQNVPQTTFFSIISHAENQTGQRKCIMNYITAENLSKSYGDKVLFKDVQFSVNEGDKIAIVAKNGSGKSTLLKILMHREIPDTGTFHINKDIQIVLFDQEISFDPDLTVEEFMMALNTPPVQALKSYHRALASQDPAELEAALAAMEEHRAWVLEEEMKQILTQLKIENLNAKMGVLSGGEVKRVALAKLLTETRVQHTHTLLIMDEPTNHLDVDMVEWLENYLTKQKITLLLVTHDRYFLDAICDIIWEIEDAQLYVHHGSYATYLENRAIREENTAATIDKANNLYRRELEWMRRQPKARTTKSKSRIDAFYDTEKVAKSAVKKENLELNFEMHRLGNKILTLQNINKKFGDKVILDNFSYSFQKGEKVGVVGKNGAGKSTLLNILQGLEPADSGEMEMGETIRFGYFSQKGLQFNEEERVIDHLRNISENFPMANGRTLSASQFLRLFLFDDQAQYAPIAKLSGGEKRRLHLMTVLYRNPNFLIFDEPTNDLDLPTLTVLENFLIQFQGCVIIVSHDRYFMDRITDHILAFEGAGKIKDFTGNFSEYREHAASKEVSEKPKSVVPPAAPAESLAKNTGRRKLSYKEAQELEHLDKNLPLWEQERAELSNQLLTLTDYQEVVAVSSKVEELTAKLEAAEDRWLELQAILEG